MGRIFRSPAIRALAICLLAVCLGIAPGAYGIPNFDGSTGWLNGNPLGSRDLAGKVVLVDFWEYTCVNCLRTLPYLRAWYARYHNDGLVIVGVHTPEFGFSGERSNVEAAAHRLNIDWPVVLDTNDAIWKRFDNDSWPHEYLFDQEGKLVATESGEGDYQKTETEIQALLKAQNSKIVLPPVMALLPQDNYLKPGAVCYLHTPELLVDRVKIANAGSSDDRKHDSSYVDPGGGYKDGAIYLHGVWRVAGEAAVASRDPAHLSMRYHAIQVVGVMTPPSGASVRVDVTQDGAPLAKQDAGSDVHYDSNGASYVTVDAPRAYELVMNAKMAFHNLQLVPAGPGVGVYSFAFESCEVPAS
ncbi:MAG: redoxin family protein [Candidatus Eremiobacteraeota bacterium]|nr:redoxin family protein [Candidatus Eremiobacteraeota bacterium]